MRRYDLTCLLCKNFNPKKYKKESCVFTPYALTLFHQNLNSGPYMTYRMQTTDRRKARAIARTAECPVWVLPLSSLFLLLLALRLIGPWAS